MRETTERAVWRPNFDEKTGLVTVVVQDRVTGEILIVAHANEEAWRRTMEIGLATFFSRSRSKLWTKGEESGNTLQVISMSIDCDGDAILYWVERDGHVACHTGARSCFYRSCVNIELHNDAPNEGEKEKLQVVRAEVNKCFVE